MMPMTTGAELIAAERERQREKGFDAEHDAAHTNGELVRAGIAFALVALDQGARATQFWPFVEPMMGDLDRRLGDSLPELVKAGAMIAAEIDRLGEL
jgi:hypothetical protein